MPKRADSEGAKYHEPGPQISVKTIISLGAKHPSTRKEMLIKVRFWISPNSKLAVVVRDYGFIHEVI